MKSRTNPSYLFLSRHGIYYFRCRIPLEVKKQYTISKNEVRKSLRTSNYSEALRKARKLWVDMAHYNNIDEMNADIERHDEMIKRGRELYIELQKIRRQKLFDLIDEKDFIHNLRSKYEYDCLRLAMDRFDSQNPTSPPPHTTTNVDFDEFRTDLKEIKTTLADDGLKAISISEATETITVGTFKIKKKTRVKMFPRRLRTTSREL